MIIYELSVDSLDATELLFPILKEKEKLLELIEDKINNGISVKKEWEEFLVLKKEPKIDMDFYGEAANPILIPIAASTRVRHRERFALFCSHLARRLKIEDGFRAIWIIHDREQLKGIKGSYKIVHVAFHKKQITGKDVFLVDDVLTTGESFIQTKRKLEKMGARSVVGLFLGKTV